MARIVKCLKLIIHIVILTLLSYFIKRQEPVKIVKKIERYVPDMKHILLWNKIPGIDEEGQKYFTRNRCEHLNCYFTMNRSLFSDLRYFDALVFNAEDVSRSAKGLPKVRSTIQKYIFASNESAGNFPVCNPMYDDFFNWTWTYKLHSSIPFRYITVYNTNNEELGADLNWKYDMKPITPQFMSSLSSKTLAAAVILDKCTTSSKREYFIHNLQGYLSEYNLTVDIFGPCGTRKCGRTSLKPCFYRIRTNYYFYLAFEDSLADDFITRSVLFAYNNNAVPVVLGAAHYNKFLPPNSYLEASRLGEKLTAKLMYEAIQNKTKYYDFFRWRNHYAMKESKILNACTLCRFLNNESWLRHSSSYKTFREWWNPYFESYCGITKYW
ncbi:hypothetical protein PYW08_006388 [Mythimna loreyi]|uniref:Uncharacterized protein n=1 Tax=Mythimna loreyi TaxID=667449 RepID=A0ACC2QN16_9NEOP|nr:hypothetical protein PYW08_006388 [Mythimna loreyi]